MSAVKKQIVLGTKNPDNLRELRKLLKDSGVEVLSVGDFPDCQEVAENGKTFEANAKKKAKVYARHTGLLTLADDSGLMVKALNGRPGVYSARFAGPGCTYRDNNEKLLRLLRKTPLSKRAAHFVCVVALCDKKGLVKVVRGECAGRIAFEASGKNGFGYDPVFIPRGFKKTFAELAPGVKNRVSHRGRALARAKAAIRDYWARNLGSFSVPLTRY